MKPVLSAAEATALCFLASIVVCGCRPSPSKPPPPSYIPIDTKPYPVVPAGKSVSVSFDTLGLDTTAVLDLNTTAVTVGGVTVTDASVTARLLIFTIPDLEAVLNQVLIVDTETGRILFETTIIVVQSCSCDTDADCSTTTGCGVHNCAIGSCVDGTCHFDSCDDGDACTDDTCDGAECVFTSVECDDGLFCNGVELCDPAVGCISGGDPCSDQGCDEEKDDCVDCMDDVDCSDELICEDGICVEAPDNVCVRDLDCGLGLTCNTETGVCIRSFPITSTFDEDHENWTIWDNGESQPDWSRADNEPGGFIGATNALLGSAIWHFDAPAKFLGDLSQAYGGTLSFELAYFLEPAGDMPLVRLVGADITLTLAVPYYPRAGWTAYSIRLDETEGWKNEVTGMVATEAEMRAVLSSLTSLLIRGDYINGLNGTLDNVAISIEPPATPPSYPIEATFESDHDGWRIWDNGTIRPDWFQAEDTSGGFIDATDALLGNARWYFDASTDFLGDLSQAYGGTLSFELAYSLEPAGDEPLVRLVGTGVVLTLEAPYYPRAGWTAYSIRLDETGGWKNADTSIVATQAEVRAVLSNLTQLLIRGDYVNGGDGALDNVAIATEPPAPPASFPIVATFESDHDGWRIWDNGTSLPDWSPSDTGPGGVIGATDALLGNARWYFDASEDFLGDLSQAYGGTLSFELAYFLTPAGDEPLVKLVGTGVVLTLAAPYYPEPTWTRYEIALDTTAGWKNVDTDLVASENDIREALSTLSQLLIRGDYVNGLNGQLDNVILAAP